MKNKEITDCQGVDMANGKDQSTRIRLNWKCSEPIIFVASELPNLVKSTITLNRAFDEKCAQVMSLTGCTKEEAAKKVIEKYT